MKNQILTIKNKWNGIYQKTDEALKRKQPDFLKFSETYRRELKLTHRREEAEKLMPEIISIELSLQEALKKTICELDGESTSEINVLTLQIITLLSQRRADIVNPLFTRMIERADIVKVSKILDAIRPLFGLSDIAPEVLSCVKSVESETVKALKQAENEIRENMGIARIVKNSLADGTFAPVFVDFRELDESSQKYYLEQFRTLPYYLKEQVQRFIS